MKQGKHKIPHQLRQQKPQALAQTLPGAPISSPQRAPITSTQGAPIFPPQGAPMPSRRKRVCPWRTEASDNAGLRQSPSQKLCVEIDNLIEKVQLILNQDSYNHQAPLIATSQLNQGTQSSLQPWSQLTRKRALVNYHQLQLVSVPESK
ncbi:hypothetical protein DPX16_16024 [Anabarilius grahami]|uniref:Uncharacterized protein n=1 Tax=Anabarilius grahami TaxID=495550 RepID=A0A3N0YVG0_ANAGA|nr:hypothetical protein DPX16_16024 [Anabarilius grahami]